MDKDMGIEWEEIHRMFTDSPNDIRLDLVKEENTQIRQQLHVNGQSVLGQILSHVSGASINGYVWLLSGADSAKSFILPLNETAKEFYPGNKLIIAYDIWGGLFALSNGDFEGDVRNVWYFAPDLLQWENLEFNYPQFIAWVCSGNLEKFYEGFLWDNMQVLTDKMKANQAVLVYPFLWAKECNMDTAEKKIVPLHELIALNADYEKKFNTPTK